MIWKQALYHWASTSPFVFPRWYIWNKPDIFERVYLVLLAFSEQNEGRWCPTGLCPNLRPWQLPLHHWICKFQNIHMVIEGKLIWLLITFVLFWICKRNNAQAHKWWCNIEDYVYTSLCVVGMLVQNTKICTQILRVTPFSKQLVNYSNMSKSENSVPIYIRNMYNFIVWIF